MPPQCGNIIYKKGPIDNNTLTSLGGAPKKTVLIFPGNDGHHNQDGSAKNGLLGVKSGGGLAQASANWGNAGNPTLSLPTVTFGGLSDGELFNLGQNAVKDLYLALGQGCNLVLPVRDHKNSTYFSKTLAGTGNNPGSEPSFWGQNATTPNPKLAKLYLDEIDKLRQFSIWMQNEAANQAQIAQFQAHNPQLWAAYDQGTKQHTPQAPKQNPQTPQPSTAKGCVPNADVKRMFDRLKQMKYPNLRTSLSDPNQFKVHDDFHYSMALTSSGDLNLTGRVTNDGEGSVVAHGNWSDEEAKVFARHLVNDLGWDSVDLSTTGQNGIPPKYINTVIQEMKQAHAQAGNPEPTIYVDGKMRSGPTNTSPPSPTTSGKEHDVDPDNSKDPPALGKI